MVLFKVSHQSPHLLACLLVCLCYLITQTWVGRPYIGFLVSSPNSFFSHSLQQDTTPLQPALDLAKASIEDLNELVAQGSIRSLDLVRAYVDRIKEVNHIFHAVSEINPDALTIAARLDSERHNGHVRGPLHGIPILLKDNIATKDKMNTTSGSYALLGAKVSREATVATKLRKAGAIILGKATMGEWAQYRSFGNISSAGWSAVGGQALGAYVPNQDPHGSSSGSAIAIALGLAAAAIGTETSGSIVNPAEKANIVGFKPTVGLTSRNMVVPISKRQDTVGPMTRTVRDAAIILDAIAGPDKYDNYTLAQPKVLPNYLHSLSTPPRPLRLGIPYNAIIPHLTQSTEPIIQAFNTAIQHLSASNRTIISPANLPAHGLASIKHNQAIVLDADFPADIRTYLSHLSHNPHGIHSLQDILSFTQAHPLEQASSRGTHAWLCSLQRNVSDTSPSSLAAHASNILAASAIESVLDTLGLDALIMPTFASFHLPAVGGQPVVSVPLGFYGPGTKEERDLRGDLIRVAKGVPFGLAFVGRRWGERELLRAAQVWEGLMPVGKEGRPWRLPVTQL